MKYIMTAIAILSLSVISIATPISGDISGIISSENSPYEVVGDLRVPQGESLEIQAGCIFDFQGNYTFTIDTSAVFKALGAPDDSIVFTATNVNPGWGAIRFLNCADTCILKYCVIEKGYARALNQGLLTHGGGIFTSNSILEIINSKISHNKAYEGLGGGIYSEYSNIKIIESEISYNNSSFEGGGLFCTNSELSLISCSIAADTSWYSLGGDWGGGLNIWYSNIEIRNCTINNNYCGQAGGGAYIGHSSGEISNNTFIDNEALDRAGGIVVSLCSLIVLSNNIVVQNSAGWAFGGGIVFYDSQGSISFNTICRNRSMNSGGGLQINNSSLDTFTNNIFWNNEVNGDSLDPLSQLYNPDNSLQLEYSCIQNGWPGEGNIDTDPLFADPDNGDFHITWDNYPSEDETKSPCIDTGAPFSPLDPDSTHADMGALYFNQWISDIDDPIALPERVRLHQNYPNPFNASTLISYELPIASQVKLDIYDILGRHIATLEDGTQPAGSHQVVWNADELASGVYFYKLQAKEYNATRKLMLIK